MSMYARQDASKHAIDEREIVHKRGNWCERVLKSPINEINQIDPAI
jgi:hypothetical protein